MDALWGRGRIGRLPYFLTSVGVGMASALAIAAWTRTHSVTGDLVVDDEAYIAAGIAVWIQATNIVRRLHDRGHAGFWLLGLFVPILGVVLALYLLFAPGDPGWNRFGTPPGGGGGLATAHQRNAHYAAVDAHAARVARDAHNEQFLNDDGSFDMDGLFRESDIERS